MRVIFKIFSFLLVTTLASSQLVAQTYWAQRAGSTGVEESSDIAIDGSGNVYTTGSFSGKATFGRAGGTSVVLTAANNADIFVSKLNSVGKVLWAVRAGGNGSDKGMSIAVDGSGNSFVTGYFQGTATFGSTTIVSTGFSRDIFIAKYNTSGVLQWVKNAGGTSSDIGNGIALDASGNIIIVGQFIGDASFGSLSLSSTLNPNDSLPSIDIFTAKYDATGSALWVKQGAAPYTDRALDVATDAAGNIYVTGQFSDTITFDNTYFNNIYNAIFIVKYNSSGDEQWVRKFGGGTQNIAYGITVDNNSNVYICGDFLNVLIYFSNPNIIHKNTYDKAIFIAKFTSEGTLSWIESDGSESKVSARDIEVDNSSNAYVIGNFECVFSEYADIYGEGTFNTIGYQDIFVSKYNASGTRQWARQLGGQNYDYGTGIAVNGSGQPHFTGYYESRMIFPVAYGQMYSGYPNYVTTLYNGSKSYCSDPSYNKFYYFGAYGRTDIFISNAIDLSRQPYDYYIRLSSACDKPILDVCINRTSTAFCPDSVTACAKTNLTAHTNTLGTVGPSFKYLWSTGQTAKTISVTTTGDYWVRLTSADGCRVSYDTIRAIINPIPPKPTISDSKGINVNRTYPSTITLCDPDTVKLTGGNYGTSTYYWNSGIYSTQIITASGLHRFNVVNEFGCSNYSTIRVNLVSADTLIPVIPKIRVLKDSVTICQGVYVSGVARTHDSITSPAGTACIKNGSTRWVVTHPTGSTYSRTSCTLSFYPSVTGWYKYKATVTVSLSTSCYSKSITYDPLFDSIYVTVNSKITINNPIMGNKSICVGQPTEIYTNSGYNNIWYGPGIIGTNVGDTIIVNQPGSYRVNSSISGNPCTPAKNSYTTVYLIPSPSITVTSEVNLICPNDSVTLSAAGGSSYEWHGPTGIVGIDSADVSVNTPGDYWVVITDTNNCTFPQSNTIEVRQYGTPSLFANAMSICPGKSTTLNVIASIGSVIDWKPPLSGGGTTKVVSEAGTYTVDITSCGIVTSRSIPVTVEYVKATITPVGDTVLCRGDSVTLLSNPGMASYEWTPGNIYDTRLTAKTTGTYSLTVMSDFGCYATTSAKIVVNPVDTVVASLNDTICADVASVQLSASGGASYKWSPDLTLSDTTISNPIAKPDSTTYYYVSTTNQYNCTTKDTVIIVVDQLPIVAAGSDNTTCNGIPVPIGGAPTSPNAITYLWSPSIGLDSTTTTNPKASPLNTTNYVITVTDSNGCKKSDTIQITPLLTDATITPVGPFCETEAPQVLNAVDPGGVWYGDGITDSITGIFNPFIARPDTHRIKYIIRDVCSDSNFIDIFIDSLVDAYITPVGPFCETDAIETLQAIDGGGVWSGTGITSPSLGTFDPYLATQGEYTITYSVVNGTCSDSKPTSIKVTDVRVKSSPIGIKCEPFCDGEVAVLSSRGTAPFTYEWYNQGSNISTSSTNTNLCSGDYSVKVTDAVGCYISNDFSIVLRSPELKADFSFSPQPITYYNPTIYFQDLSVRDIIEWDWIFFDVDGFTTLGGSVEQDPIFKYPFKPGSYPVNLHVKTIDNCEYDTILTVIINNNNSVFVPNSFTPNKDGINDVFKPEGTGLDPDNTTFSIFNRWGDLIFESSNIDDGWDGTGQGRVDAPQGVYIWKVITQPLKENTDGEVKRKELVGRVTLVR